VSRLHDFTRVPAALSSRRDIVGYLVALACLLWVFHDLRIGDLFRNVDLMNWWWVGAAIGFDVASYVCQGWRWALLLSPNGRLTTLQATQAIYAALFVNEILPLRAGEALRIYLGSLWLGTRVVSVVSSVLVERFFDGIWLALAAAATVLLVPLPRYLVDAEEVLAAIVALSMVIFVYLVMGKPKARDRGAPVKGIRGAVSRMIHGLAAGVGEIGRSRYLYASFAGSGCLLAFQVLAFWLVLRAYGVPLTFWQGAAVALILHLGTALPGAPSNLGTYQFFTVVGLTQFGVDKTTATGFSVVVFIILTIPLWAIGGYAFARAGLTLRAIRHLRAGDGLQPPGEATTKSDNPAGY
jgi:glycosyltransferase 2 family protein